MSIYESMINPRVAEQQRLARHAQQDELIHLYEAHARHVQSYDFQCNAACTAHIYNVHEHLCNRGIVAWPSMPEVRICQCHRRLYFNPDDNAHRQMADLYVASFPYDAEGEIPPCGPACLLLSVPMVLYHAGRWRVPWLPISVCMTHSTLHACSGSSGGIRCRNRSSSGRSTVDPDSEGGLCGACQVGRLCYERCPVNASNVDRHAGHVCLFSNTVIAYLSDVAFAKWDTHANDVSSRKNRRAAASESSIVLHRMGAMQQWITHAVVQGRRAVSAASAASAVVSRAEAEERIANYLIETGRLCETAFVLEPRDIWQFMPMLYASFGQPMLPCLADDTEVEYAACNALLFLFDTFFMQRVPVVTMLQRVANADSVFATLRATDLLRNYATLMMHFVPPGGVPALTLPARFDNDEEGSAAAWLASAKTEKERAAAAAAIAAAAEALPMRMRTEALRNHALFFFCER